MYVAPGFQGHELWMALAMSSCYNHRPVTVYEFSPHICPSLAPIFYLTSLYHPLSSCLSCPDADMNARPARMHVSVRGGGSPVTKLADEACDLFKGMPKSQH